MVSPISAKLIQYMVRIFFIYHLFRRPRCQIEWRKSQGVGFFVAVSIVLCEQTAQLVGLFHLRQLVVGVVSGLVELHAVGVGYVSSLCRLIDALLVSNWFNFFLFLRFLMDEHPLLFLADGNRLTANELSLLISNELLSLRTRSWRPFASLSSSSSSDDSRG